MSMANKTGGVVRTLSKEPFNLIVAGVGGQGNVLLSAFIGMALVREGFTASVSDTFGVSQRGGSVTSHIRISLTTPCSSVTLAGQADVILGMEPVETLRALGEFGNRDVVAIVNPRPMHPAGGVPYPDLNEVTRAIVKLSARTMFVHATEEALRMGDPIYTNVILLGALTGADVLPVGREAMLAVLKERFPGAVYDINLVAFNKGVELAREASGSC
jgi:indolepyruvate ferredoxin oxidoreductase beta subunit